MDPLRIRPCPASNRSNTSGLCTGSAASRPFARRTSRRRGPPPSEKEAVIWRGPIISSFIKQFYEDFDWGELDYLLVDLPPGTADVPLTVMQSIPLDGILLVISPQELAGMIVGKARKMAASLEVPVIGLVENMAFVLCPSCGERVEPYGVSHSEQAAEEMGIPLLGRLPLDPEISRLADEGKLDEYRSEQVEAVVDGLLKQTSNLASPVESNPH